MTYDIRFAAKAEDGTKLGSIHLRHAPIDADKIVRLREDMLVNGWRGRGVVMLDCGDHCMAFSGVHRLCAAQGIDGLAQIVWLPSDLRPDQWAEIENANDDDDLLRAFEAIAEERDDMIEAIAAMRAEVESNG